MDTFRNARIKWPYVTHLVDHRMVAGVLPPVVETNPGSLVLARVRTLGEHRDLEGHDGRRMSLFAGDVVAGVLASRRASGRVEAEARCAGALGHLLGPGGVCGLVVGTGTDRVEPTVIEWLGRLAGADGRPLHLRQFRMRPERAASGRPASILSLGASTRAGKTTTAAQVIRSLVNAGHRVAAAKVTGTACRKDPDLLHDAGAVAVLDFTYAGWPSTCGCSREELLATVALVRAGLAAHRPDFVIMEIADGIAQRESALLLEDESFRDSVDAVTFAAPDVPACETGIRRLRELDYRVLAAAGPVADTRPGRAQVDAGNGVRRLSGDALLSGALVPDLQALRHAISAEAARTPVPRRVTRGIRMSGAGFATREPSPSPI
jgi:hypothetical protein